jgi:hypothetical protein
MVFSRSWYRPDMLPMARNVRMALPEPVNSLFRTAFVCDHG